MAILLSRRAESAGVLIPRAELGPMEEPLPVDLVQLLHPIPPGLSRRALQMEQQRRGTFHAYTGSYALQRAQFPTDNQPAPRRALRGQYEGSQAAGDAERRGLAPVAGPPAFRDLNDFLGWAGGVAKSLGQLTRNPILTAAGQLAPPRAPASAPAPPAVAADGSGVLDASARGAAPGEVATNALEFSKGTFDTMGGTVDVRVEVIGGGIQEFATRTDTTQGIQADGTPAGDGEQAI